MIATDGVGRRLALSPRLERFLSPFPPRISTPMATQSKAQFLNDVHTHLKTRYKPKPERSGARLTVVEAVIYGICHENTTREQANQALSRFKDGFFDWNEVRVSSLEEIQGTLAGLTDPEGRAQRIRRFLRQLFDRTYGFTLEALAKKPLKDALNSLEEYEALNSDYVAATVIHQALGGHAIPVDAFTHRALVRLGVTAPDTDLPTLRTILERAVPKNRGGEFLDLIEELAHDTCIEREPDCPHCELRKICPTACLQQDDVSASQTHKEVQVPKPQTLKATKDGAKRRRSARTSPPRNRLLSLPRLPGASPAMRSKRPSTQYNGPRHPGRALTPGAGRSEGVSRVTKARRVK